MKQCEGQISLMDLITSTATKDVPLILLAEGQTVYKVVRGDIETHIVTGKTWTCGCRSRHRWGPEWMWTWNSQIGKIIFTSREPAERVAQEYLAEYEHILAENIRATGVIAYRYEYRGREIVQSYSILEDGTFYFKYGSMYEHIGKEVEIKKFEEERQHCIERNDTYAVLENYKPQYKNMYKCGHSSWVYAEARYEYIND